MSPGRATPEQVLTAVQVELDDGHARTARVAILGLLWLVALKTGLRQIYRKRMAESRRERMFLAAVGFFTLPSTMTSGRSTTCRWPVSPWTL